MSQRDQVNILKRALAREKASRKAAEAILEAKSAELYEVNRKLEESYTELISMYNRTSSELQGVFENIVDAYVIMDINGNILKFNEAATQLFGYDIDKESLNVAKLIYKEDYEYAMASFSELQSQGYFKNYEARVYTKSREVKWVHINASLIVDKHGVTIAAQGIVRDITLIRSLRLQKEKLLERLEKSNDELQEYAHIVSHDLKSPLRSINALLSWTKEDNKGKLDEATLQNFGHIEVILEKMEQLISDVLTYSSVGVSDAEDRDVNLYNLVKDLVAILYVPDNVIVSIDQNLPTIKGDKTKLQQLFQNLISNAVKFLDKPQGKIDIKVKELPSYFEFSVSDNGVGIEEKFYDKIFKIFHSLNKSKDSSGIGLSIVKKIVNLYDGQIWLESEPGHGTTFYFTLKKQ